MTVLVAGSAMTTLLALCGCRQRADDGPSTDGGAPTAPAYETLRDAQNDRVAKLATLETAGVLEMQWTDADGDEHFEPQIDIKLLFQQPRKLSLRLYKFDTVMWLGSDEERYWLFDLISRDTSVVYVGAWDEEDGDDGEGAARGELDAVLHPTTLLDLVGLFPAPQSGALEWDAQRSAWMMATLPGRGGTLRAWFDAENLHPIRVESIDAESEDPANPRILAFSELSDYTRVESRGMPPSAFPRLPRRIVIHEGAGGSGLAKVTLDGPTTEVDLARLERATDYELLKQTMRPDEERLVGRE